MKSVAVALGLLAMATALPGCSGSSDPIQISGPDADGQYSFKSGVSADEYVWDLGDHLTTMTDKSFKHTYDFPNGAIKVRLTTKSGETTETYEKALVLGTGINEKPALSFLAMTEWGTTAEPFTLSASTSTDPDGDALRYTWTCLQKGIYRVNPHTDTLPPSTVSAAATSIQSGFANGTTLPAPTMTLTGDFCAALNAATWPSKDAGTIQGTFAQAGFYTIGLIASDGPNSEVSGSIGVYVTTPAERPDVWHRETFSGTLIVGTPSMLGQDVQTVCDLQEDDTQTCDEADHAFDISLNLLNGYVNATLGAGAPPQSAYTWDLYNGGNFIITGAGTESKVFPASPKTIYGTYHVYVYGETGTQIPYSITFAAKLNVNPRTVYEIKLS